MRGKGIGCKFCDGECGLELDGVWVSITQCCPSQYVVRQNGGKTQCPVGNLRAIRSVILSYLSQNKNSQTKYLPPYADTSKLPYDADEKMNIVSLGLYDVTLLQA